MFVWITGIARSRRRMEEKGREKATFVNLGHRAGVPAWKNVSDVSAEFSMLCHYLFWPFSSACSSMVNECTSFPQQQAWVPHVPSPDEQPEKWVGCRSVHGVARNRMTVTTKLGKGLTEDSWPNCVADAQPAKSVEVCVILCRLKMVCAPPAMQEKG